MNFAKMRRALASAIALTCCIGAANVVISPAATADYGAVTATTAVNVRSGPGTNTSKIGLLYAGDTVTQTGPAKNDWTPVKYHGKDGWIASRYLKSSKVDTESRVSNNGGTGNMVTVTALNVRSGPGTSHKVVTTLSKNTTVTLTGSSSGRFVQIKYGKSTAWVCQDYLISAGEASTAKPSTPAASTSTTSSSKLTEASRARTTTAIMVRTGPSTSYKATDTAYLGTVLSLTGKSSGGFSEIIWKGTSRWVSAQYLTPVGSTATVTKPTTPSASVTKYTTAILNIRSTSAPNSSIVGQAPKGTALQLTGVVQNNMAQIIYNGSVRWASNSYLTATAPPANSLDVNGCIGLDALRPTTKNIVYTIKANYPQIKTMYGVRPDPLPDHPSGRAVDLMIPNWRNNKKLGWQIATYLRNNAKKLNIQYIIYDQQIWNISRDREGWRKMADRGSNTANHLDHIHITVKS